MNRNNSIQNKSIFGEYKKGEDSVTAAFLQLLKLGGPDLMSVVFDGYPIDMGIHINTQVKGQVSRPDGEIRANYHMFIESKIKPWHVGEDHNCEQLKNHVDLAKKERATLLYITVEEQMPQELTKYPGVIWTNWTSVVEKLKEYKSDFNNDVMAFLVSQFELLVDNLVTDSAADDIPEDERVIVVGGRYAENMALKYSFYACQNGRSFKKSKYIAFYFDKHINSVFEIKDGPRSNTILSKVNAISKEYFEVSNDRDESPRTLFLLEKGEHLNGGQGVLHQSNVAFVRFQRYVNINKLKHAKTTADL